MSTFHHWYQSIVSVFSAINFIGIFFSLVYVTRLCLANLKEFKFHRDTGGINSFMRFNLLFNSETKLYKNLLLTVMLLIELFVYILLVTIISIESHFRIDFNSHFHVNSSIQCRGENEEFHVEYIVNLLFHYQLIILIPFFLAVLSVTGVLVSSFLTSYLCRRYHGYSLDNRIKRKYVVWWCYQVVLLLLCCLPYLQVFSCTAFYILFTVDMVIFVHESRRLVRILKSVANEILHFEYDEVRYKQSYSSYYIYTMFFCCQFAYLFAFDLLVFVSQISYTVQYVILLNCNYKENFLSYFQVEIATEGFNSFLHVNDYFIYIFVMLLTLLSSFPWILFCCISLTRYCIKQINILKYEKRLSHQFIHR